MRSQTSDTSATYSRLVTSAVTWPRLAALKRDEVAALHIMDISQIHYLVNPPTDLSENEQAYVRHGEHWQSTEGGYMDEQSTKLQTIAAPLGDSPAGLAAWILEKLHGWTDCDDNVESIFSKDELLTWISSYWFENCIGTSFSPYAEDADMSWKPITVPTALTIFPKDLVNGRPGSLPSDSSTCDSGRSLNGGHCRVRATGRLRTESASGDQASGLTRTLVASLSVPENVARATVTGLLASAPPPASVRYRFRWALPDGGCRKGLSGRRPRPGRDISNDKCEGRESGHARD